MLYLVIFLLVLGVVALLLETLLTGIEIFGIAGVVSLAAAAILAVVFLDHGWFIVSGVAVILGLFAHYLYRFFRRKQLNGHLILSETLPPPPVEDLSHYMGKEGRTLTYLRPSGTAEFNGQEREVTAQNGVLVESGKKIRVVKVEGPRIFVTVVDEN